MTKAPLWALLSAAFLVRPAQAGSIEDVPVNGDLGGSSGVQAPPRVIPIQALGGLSLPSSPALSPASVLPAPLAATPLSPAAAASQPPAIAAAATAPPSSTKAPDSAAPSGGSASTFDRDGFLATRPKTGPLKKLADAGVTWRPYALIETSPDENKKQTLYVEASEQISNAAGFGSHKNYRLYFGTPPRMELMKDAHATERASGDVSIDTNLGKLLLKKTGEAFWNEAPAVVGRTPRAAGELGIVSTHPSLCVLRYEGLQEFASAWPDMEAALKRQGVRLVFLDVENKSAVVNGSFETVKGVADGLGWTSALKPAR